MTAPPIARVAAGLPGEVQRHLTDEECQALALLLFTFPTARLEAFEPNEEQPR